MIENYESSERKWEQAVKDAKHGMPIIITPEIGIETWADWFIHYIKTPCGFCNEFEYTCTICPLWPKYCNFSGVLNSALLWAIYRECNQEKPDQLKIVAMCEQMLAEIKKHKDKF